MIHHTMYPHAHHQWFLSVFHLLGLRSFENVQQVQSSLHTYFCMLPIYVCIMNWEVIEFACFQLVLINSSSLIGWFWSCDQAFHHRWKSDWISKWIFVIKPKIFSFIWTITRTSGALPRGWHSGTVWPHMATSAWCSVPELTSCACDGQTCGG